LCSFVENKINANLDRYRSVIMQVLNQIVIWTFDHKFVTNMTYAFIIKIIQYVYLLMLMLSGVKILLHMNRLLVRFFCFFGHMSKNKETETGR